MQATLQSAVRLHQQGRLEQAEALYREVLTAAPAQFDALHLLGVIARQRGDAQAAVDMIGAAIRVDAAPAAPHCNLGAALADLGRHAEALTCFELAIARNPGYAMAFLNRGNALRNLGRSDAALDSYERALDIQPSYPEALCNRGLALHDLGLHAPALHSVELALMVKGDHRESLFAHGLVLQSLERHQDAIDAYDRLLSGAPAHAQAWCNRGLALQRLARYMEALDSHAHAIAARPAFANAHKHRATCLRLLNRPDDAIAALRLAREHGADRAEIDYALAALGQGAAPPAAPGQYVQELFDQYADHFDQHLVEVLKYDMPAALADAIGRHRADTLADTLDLGCGTGLCGPHLRPWSRTLAGVDLSRKMLAKAAERGLYDQLECGDLLAFLDARRESSDLVVAADVFVYIGDLAPVFARVALALRPAGLFCFSVEEGTSGVTLQASQRYAHSRAHIERLAQTHGFAECEIGRRVGRQDSGADVGALAVVLRKR